MEIIWHSANEAPLKPLRVRYMKEHYRCAYDTWPAPANLQRIGGGKCLQQRDKPMLIVAVVHSWRQRSNIVSLFLAIYKCIYLFLNIIFQDKISRLIFGKVIRHEASNLATEHYGDFIRNLAKRGWQRCIVLMQLFYWIFTLSKRPREAADGGKLSKEKVLHVVGCW